MHPFIAMLWVGLGSAIGGMLRFALAVPLDAFGADTAWGPLPYGTLLVNVLGSFVIGLAAGLATHDLGKHLVLIGVLGGFTTYSSFSLQAVRLLDGGHAAGFIGYVAVTVIACVAGAFLGVLVGRLIWPAAS